MVEVNTSPKASVPAALRADELILLPKFLLNFESQILNPMDINKSKKGIISKVTASGFNILENEVLTNWNPTSITIKETTRAEIYSILPWPKGCSASAGLLAILNPIIVIIDEAASDKLLNASAIIAIDPANNPTNNLIRNSSVFIMIPTAPPKFP